MVTQLYFLGYALVVTPYLALLPEIAGSTVQRLNLTTGQAIAAMGGTLVFATGGLVIQSGGYIALGWMLATVLPFALLADVIDLDSEQSRIRREAIYFGVQAIFQKSMIGVSVVCFAWIHERTGPTGLSWIALTAGAACALGLMTFCFYPVRR